MSNRWNFEMQDGKLWVCHNNHEKGQPCEYEPATVDDVEYFRGRIAALEKELLAEQVLHNSAKKLNSILSEMITDQSAAIAGYLKEQGE